ncbi:porin [Haloferula chungangensis]|uniref:porin n=1 Tax=Haloferula chungangensis TaxID=1048331 RepID=UPI0036D3E049
MLSPLGCLIGGVLSAPGSLLADDAGGLEVDCKDVVSLAMLHKDAEDPWIQEFKLSGRFHWQAAYLQGRDANHYEFSDDYTEVRRFRLGAGLKFLNFFSANAGVNMVDDARNNLLPWPGGRKLGWGYEDFDIAVLSFDIGKAFGVEGVDDLAISYGRQKFNFSHEGHRSSNNLPTVERSAVSNKVYGGYRPTGLSIDAAKGDWTATLGIFSTDARTRIGGNVDFLGSWTEGVAYYSSVSYSACKEWAFTWDVLYNDADVLGGEDSLWGYKWATSVSGEYSDGRWGLIVDGIYGDNGGPSSGTLLSRRQGDFWGVVVMPYYWIVEGRLQGVLRYQYQGSENDRGSSVNSRYIRRVHGPSVDLSTYVGRGDAMHSLYAGVTTRLCGSHLKVQCGLEYDWLNIPGAGVDGELSAFTYWFGLQTFF